MYPFYCTFYEFDKSIWLCFYLHNIVISITAQKIPS